MAEEPQVIRGINWRETFPFTHLFRAFRVAVHPSKLVLGLILLLSIYTGGRILDGIWPARHLAVPDEINHYEQARFGGASSQTFLEARRSARTELESAHARRLLAENVETDPEEAAEEARSGGEVDELKEKIIRRRDQSVAAAAKARDEALAAAKNLSGREREDAERATELSFEQNRRAVYRTAYEEYRDVKQIKGVGLFRSFFEYQSGQVMNVVRGVLAWNFFGGWNGNDDAPGVARSVLNFFTVGPMWLMRFHPVYFVLFSLMFLTLWAIFGGAIARIAAVHVARDEKLSVRAALQFSIGKFLSFVSAPLIPLIIVLLVGLVPILAGLLASIPYIGPLLNILVGALFVLVLAAGFVMTLVLLGTFGGFNLMYPTIAVEGSDSFDAISRSFSYVYARPWRMIFYTLVAIIYGALCYVFVRLFVGLMLALTHQFVDIGHFADAPSGEPLWQTMWIGPHERLSYDIDFLTLRGDQDIAAALTAFWVYLVIGMIGAFVISFYFSANTIIYYLMRREVDATEPDDVYLEQSDEDFSEPIPHSAVADVPSDGDAGTTPASGDVAPAPATPPPPPAPPPPGAEPPLAGDSSDATDGSGGRS
ncbi:MAG TPA: hypothetical protein VGR35_13555 [Tepidisphaeraceae bacterium]|nr:hypothetical protein [Tepidisphaeraceae bacterium]